MLAQIASISRFAAPTSASPASFELAAGPRKLIFRDAASSSTVVQCEGIFFFGDVIEILGPSTIVYADLPRVYVRPDVSTRGLQIATFAAVTLQDAPAAARTPESSIILEKKAAPASNSKDAYYAQKNQEPSTK